jgi:DnaJ homolog subfamily A member 2
MHGVDILWRVSCSCTHSNTHSCKIHTQHPSLFVEWGRQWKITHLDGRELVIKTRPGQVIQCEISDEASGRTLPYICQVANEGMPSAGNPFVKGHLYVAFHVQFPKTLPANIVDQLRTLLPDPDVAEPYNAETTEEHLLDEADLRLFGKGGAASSSNEYDSDDDERGGRQGVQCQQS